MATNGGPRIVRDGLVLHLDAANVKSFRGEPTVNLQDPNINNWSKNVILEELDIPSPANSTVYSLTDSSTTSYLNISRNITVANDSSTYTISIYIKKTYGATSARLGFNSGFSGGTTLVQLNQRFNSDTGVGNVGTTIDLGTWWRWSFQLTNNSSGNTTLYCSFYPATGLYNSGDNAVATGTAVISGIQIEQKVYATPFVNGTRGATLATGGGWADKSGNNNHGTLLNGITYSTNGLGSLVFDGVDDTISFSSNTLLNTPNGFTAEVWTKFNNSSAHVLIHKDSVYSIRRANSTTLQWADGTNWSYANWGSTSPSFTYNTSNTNKYYQIIATKSGSLVSIYLDGILIVQKTFGSTGVGGNTNPLYIGSYSGANSFLNGSIAITRVYNKALTAEEVLQNYEATKSRYNL
jgi:hypothetical protein